MTIKSCLTINALELELFLGWPTEERMRKQIVTLDLQIKLPVVPEACESDDLKDTVCYRDLIEKLRAAIATSKYHLIEHVTAKVYSTLKSILPAESVISVSLTKRPQIQGLQSVTFQYVETGE